LFRFTITDCSWEITNANPRKAISVPIVNTSELTLRVAIAKPWAAPNAADAATAYMTTATGDLKVIDRPQLEAMRDGAILANSGHFNDEINIPALAELAVERRAARDFVEEFKYADGRRIYLLADGRLVNLSAAEGHPAGVMDMSFANQALSAEYVAQNHQTLENRVYIVPLDIDREVARLKLKAMGTTIDVLTAEQEKYLGSWESGT